MEAEVPTILQNALKITIKGRKPIYIQSVHQHHFVQYGFDDNSYVFIDGGRVYHRTGSSGTLPKGVKVEDFSLKVNDNPARIHARLLWGTRGKKGNNSLTFIRIKDCSTKHLKAILKYKFMNEVSPLHLKVIQKELKSRK